MTTDQGNGSKRVALKKSVGGRTTAAPDSTQKPLPPTPLVEASIEEIFAGDLIIATRYPSRESIMFAAPA